MSPNDIITPLVLGALLLALIGLSIGILAWAVLGEEREDTTEQRQAAEAVERSEREAL